MAEAATELLTTADGRPLKAALAAAQARARRRALLLVLPLRNASPRTIVLLMALCAVYPVVSGSLRLMIMTPDMTAMLVQESQAMEASNRAIYPAGNFLQTAAENSHVFRHLYGSPMNAWASLGFWMQMTLTMLLGLLAGHLRWPQPGRQPASVHCPQPNCRVTCVPRITTWRSRRTPTRWFSMAARRSASRSRKRWT